MATDLYCCFTFRLGALFLCLRVYMDGCAVVADGYVGGLMGSDGSGEP